MRSGLFLLVFFFPIMLYSQTFTGKVQGSKNAPLVGASVVVTTKENKTLAYSITTDMGGFKLIVPAEKNPAYVIISSMGYQKKTIPFKGFKNGMTITLAEGDFKLKEVKVTAQRLLRSGDTLTYSVSGFRQGQDRSIADVISKMPGLEVNTNGQIEYQGKAISKFYIEGLDLMGSQYGVANQNLSADKVKSVQVLENHQAVKSLRGVTFSEQAALNIVLKDDAKEIWSGAADVGAGYGSNFLYDSRLMGMRFNKKFQTLMMYKNNNMGKDINSEVHDLTSFLKERRGGETSLLSLMSVGTPDLSAERYTFNRSHLVAGNWLWKTGKDAELRLQGTGFMDQTSMQGYSSSAYLTLAGLPVIVEEQDVCNTRSEWKGEANYQFNGDKTYIRDNLRGSISFNKSLGSIQYNGQYTPLMVKPHKRSLTHDFQLSHTTEKGHVYVMDSYLASHYLPGQLLTINGMTEKLNLGFFSTQNGLRYKLKLGRHYLNNDVGFLYDRQKIEVALEDKDWQSAVYQLLHTYWTPSISFLWGKHKFDVKSQISYVHQSYRDSGRNHLWADPTISWNWKAGSLSEFSASVGHLHSPLTGNSIYDTPVFTGYRTLRKNRGETGATHSLRVSAGYKYFNPVFGLFFNLNPSYSCTSGNILYESMLQGNIYTLTATEKESSTRSVGFTSRISKTFGWAKTILALGISQRVSNYSLLVSGDVHDARMIFASVNIDYAFRPLKILSVEGKSQVFITRQQDLTRPLSLSGSTTDWEHSLHFHVFPSAQWMFSIKNEFFHTTEKSVGMNYFLDGAISYKSKRWELSFTANNLIGTSKFERRALSNTLISYSVTKLRPREFLFKWCFDF